MVVHSVPSSIVAGFGYDFGTLTLRIVIKGKSGVRVYDYHGVTEEDAGIFAQGLGKSLNYIRVKYGDRCERVPDTDYSSV